MRAAEPAPYRAVAEQAWRWVLDQVRWGDGPWIPVSVPSDSDAPPEYCDGMHSGIGGLAYVLAEIRLARPWTDEERVVADAIVERLRRMIAAQHDYTFFDGLVSSIGALIALDGPGTDAALDRLTALAEPDGWPQTLLGTQRYTADARINDLTLGTAGVLLGALWARRHGHAGRALAEHAAGVLLAEAEPEPSGLNWRMVSARHCLEPPKVEMPNFSHGVAGIATALALAGAELDRPDLTDAARSGAEHLLALGERDGDGFVVPRYLPRDYNDQDEITYTWCHGGTGTSLLFPALRRAGVTDVAGRDPLDWQRRFLQGVRASGLPVRRHPGFWDNDGRCCGTAGVGDTFLDAWLRTGDDGDRDFAVSLADTLVERAVHDGPHAYWRFLEHHADEPLLPPGVGWMQGAAGIAAFLFRVGRVVTDGPAAPRLARMDTWWAVSDR